MEDQSAAVPAGSGGGRQQEPLADRLLLALAAAGRDGVTVRRLSRDLQEPAETIDAASRALQQQGHVHRSYSARDPVHDRLRRAGQRRSSALGRGLRGSVGCRSRGSRW